MTRSATRAKTQIFPSRRLRPLPLGLFRKRLSLRPPKSRLRTAAIICLFAASALSYGVFEYFVRDILARTRSFEDYRVDHSAFPANSSSFYRDMTWDGIICYLCLILGTAALFLALRLVWKRILIEITQTKDFENSN